MADTDVRITDCEDPEPGPAPRPDALYVVSDGAGFVGAFPTAAAAEAVTRPHPHVPFLAQRFAVAPGPVDAVWVVLYRDLDAVAFVSNDRAEAARVQKIYADVGLAYPDDIDYWEQPFGAVAKGAAERLDIQSRAYSAWETVTEADLDAAEEADAARAAALCAARADGPLARVLRETERLTILDAVVPWAPCAGAGLRDGEDPGVGGPDCGSYAASLAYDSYVASLAVEPRARDEHARWVESAPAGEREASPEGAAPSGARQ